MKKADRKALMCVGCAIHVVKTLHRLAAGAPTESDLGKLQKRVETHMKDNGVPFIKLKKTATSDGDSLPMHLERHARIIKLYIIFANEIEINSDLKNFIKIVKEASNGTWETEELVMDYPMMKRAFTAIKEGVK